MEQVNAEIRRRTAVQRFRAAVAALWERHRIACVASGAVPPNALAAISYDEKRLASPEGKFHITYRFADHINPADHVFTENKCDNDYDGILRDTILRVIWEHAVDAKCDDLAIEVSLLSHILL